jgi:hypothetical protein
MRQLRSLSERRLIRPVTHRVHSPQPNPPPGRITQRTRPTRMGMTQDLTAAASSFADPAYDTPTPPPKLMPARAPVPAPSPPPRVTRALMPVPSPSPPPKITRDLVTVSPQALVRATPVTTPPRLSSMGVQAVDLWFSLSKRDWSTLVVIPAHRLGSALSLACAVAEAGSAMLRRPIELLSAEGKDLIPNTEWMFPRLQQFERVIALDPISVNPMGIPVAQSAGACLIVAEKGVADLATIHRTIEAIGRKHFLGSVLIAPQD